MKFIVNERIRENFPSLSIGVIIAKGIDNRGENADVMQLLKDQSAQIRTTYDLNSLAENSHIMSRKEAFRSFGAKPKKYRCSVENLYRMILDGVSLGHINTIVDIYNYISLKYLIPVGGDDIDHIDGNITLTYAQGDETFTQLNSDKIIQPREGEIVYKDEKEILCRRRNRRECDKSKMTEDTKSITLVMESLAPMTKENMESIMHELATLVTKFCGGKSTTHLLSADNPEVML